MELDVGGKGVTGILSNFRGQIRESSPFFVIDICVGKCLKSVGYYPDLAVNFAYCLCY